MSSAPRKEQDSPEPVPAVLNLRSLRPQNPAPGLANAQSDPTQCVYISPRAGNTDLSGTPHSSALIPAMPQQPCIINPETARETGIESGPVFNNNRHLSDSRLPESDLGSGLAPNNNNVLSLEPQTGSTNKRKKMSELSEEEKERKE
ncbi:MAG: hypothetical protein MHMPM18_002878 [Marteilia pararefringens]